MNKERILALADLIEKLPYQPVSGFDSGFCMSDFTDPECGSPLCIGGWSCWEALGHPEDVNRAVVNQTYITPEERSAYGGRLYTAVGGTWLGLDPYEATDLFFPDRVTKSWDAITPAEAAKVLRHLAETGEVDWSIING